MGAASAGEEDESPINGGNSSDNEALPDLVIESVSCEPVEPEPGEQVRVTVTVKNQGIRRSGRTNLACFISGDDIQVWGLSGLEYYGDGNYAGDEEIRGLHPGSSDSISFTVVPETEGTVEIKVQADTEESVIESDEENNEETYFITSKNGGDPDLVVETISCEPANPEPEKAANIEVIVKNEGKEKSASTDLVYYISGIDGTEKGEEKVPEIPPESSISMSFPWIPKREETVMIGVEVDPDNLVYESNEWNNEKIEFVNVYNQKSPDLVIEKITWQPENPEPEETVSITVTVKNQGTERSGETDLEYEVGGTEGEREVRELDPDSETSISFSWTPETGGTAEIRARVDPKDLVFESDEGNNEETGSIIVEKKTFPDLVIENISWEPVVPDQGETVSITITVRNLGTERSGETDLEYEVGGTEGEREVRELDPGSETSISVSWTPGTGGTEEIRARVDPNDRVFESNEGNNEKTGTITVVEEQASSDLVIEDLSWEPFISKPGEAISITITVRNLGTERSGETNLEYEVGGTEGEREVRELDPGSETSISVSWTPEKGGTEEIRARVDPEDRVFESNEGNNEKAGTIIVVEEQASSDLVIEELSWEPVEAEPGKTLNFALTVRNLGTEPAQSSTAMYYIDGTSGEEISIPALLPGKDVKAEFSLIPENEGEIEIRVVADSGNDVPESNEANNEIVRNVTVKAEAEESPDLIIETLTWKPQNPKPEESVEYTVTVKNEGSVTSGPADLEYYIAGEYEGNLSVPALSGSETSTGTFTWIPEKEGNFEVRVVVDSENAVFESRETNNEIKRTVTVSKKVASSGSGGSKKKPKPPSVSGGGSKEPAKNVQVKELSTRYIIYGYHVRFDFVENATCITCIEFDPKRSFKRTTTIAEVLKGKTTLASIPAPGKVYKNVNIWVGDSGAGMPEVLENGYIEFKVEKAWIENNDINESLISMLRYDKKWEPLYTEKVGEDKQCTYFKSSTPGYSSFAIAEYTGKEETIEEETAEEEILVENDELHGALGSLNKSGKSGVINGSGEKEESNEEGKTGGISKIMMLISLPIFLILSEYLVMKIRK
ncbi:PGF-pre-PGF domain-containing protein [Methanosarcina sp. KYL-1]|uniref:CARDB domain-containing protein n=1 Tax=Methanosarcina sp. KYL-1 TaxID=2602068 RepID=UPI002100DE6C|nr:CARDB domain-containing protein [Methanosarcina sp. KYL-1]MCQ1536576.1 PGF-pre-PGF domain-containing protein [Methanosarcina sp. KYL-1]